MFDLSTKLLVVDDMATMRRIVIKSCMELGFKTFVEAADGVLAWERLAEEPSIGLVICDWNMPNLSGIDLLKKVRADENLKNLPFVLLTVDSEVAQVKEALDIGVDNYVIKPFTVEILKRKLEDAHKKVLLKSS